ncbi:NAD(P)H dehydrogenase (quinone) [Duganella sp. 1224]|uniref:NAD(P)H-binding protein n=1 Tax=Duganella sp. 1224 TaxID=2587052 RepID=UPI0015CC3EED|nr:NAD(P)H-binding protein [Duganella sp. 1224]NYE59339.1 NAD(P)H dehydrogenase (quinone) [Duganella sp. 1224]
MHTTLLVAGASGHLGRLVLQHLRRLGAHHLIATTRTPSSGQRYADFDNADSLPAAFAGAQRMLLISTALGYAGPRRVAQHRNAIDAAVRAGVKSIVYTSLLGAVNDDHTQTETMLRDSGLPHIILRNAYYMEPLRDTLAAAAGCGKLVSAATIGRAAYITRDDCALAAAHALLLPPATRQLDIVGPQALSGADLAKIGSEAFGKPIAFSAVGPGERADMLAAQGTPPQLARMIAHVEKALDSGMMDSTSKDYTALTGRQACTLRDFLLRRTRAPERLTDGG